MGGFGRVTASSPKRPLDPSAGSVELSGERPFAASAKAFGQFPQTGHSPRNDGKRPTNDCIADEAAVRCKRTKSWASNVRSADKAAVRCNRTKRWGSNVCYADKAVIRNMHSSVRIRPFADLRYWPCEGRNVPGAVIRVFRCHIDSARAFR